MNLISLEVKGNILRKLTLIRLYFLSEAGGKDMC